MVIILAGLWTSVSRASVPRNVSGTFRWHFGWIFSLMANWRFIQFTKVIEPGDELLRM